MALINPPGSDTVDRQDGGRLMEVNAGWRNFFMAVYRILQAITLSGTTAQRPTQFLWVGRPYFDTTLGQMLFLSQVSPPVWVVPVPTPGGGTTGQILRAVTGLPPIWSTTLWPNAIGSNEVVTQVGGGNNIASRASFTFDGGTEQVAADNPGGDMTMRVRNINNANAASRAVQHIQCDIADALTKYEQTGTQTVSTGWDASAAAWKVSMSGALGTNDVLAITAAGAIKAAIPPAFVAGDLYVVMDAGGNIHLSTLGPAA